MSNQEQPTDKKQKEFGDYYKGKETLYPITEPKTLMEMSWQEVETALEETDIILVMTGSVENHGPHLPLGADALKARVYGQKIATRLEKDGIEIVIGPTIPFGITPYNMGFPGTITLETETHLRLIKDVCGCLIEHGFENVILLNTHGGNGKTVPTAAVDLANEYEYANVVHIDTNSIELRKFKEMNAHNSEHPELEYHGGETETSRMLYAFQKLVMLDRADAEWHQDDGQFLIEEVGKYERDWEPGTLTAGEYKEIWPMGHGGNPNAAKADSGELLFDITVDHLCGYIKEFVVNNK